MNWHKEFFNLIPCDGCGKDITKNEAREYLTMYKDGFLPKFYCSECCKILDKNMDIFIEDIAKFIKEENEK